MSILGRFFSRTAGNIDQSVADHRKRAELLLGERRYREAAQCLEAPALQNDPWSQYSMARLAANGLGVPKDDEKSAALFLRAAQGGFVQAQCALGIAYILGRGVESSPAQAIHWLTRAAEGGDASAQFNLAKAYSDGFGVQRDDGVAAAWMLKAAESGFAEAKLGVAIWSVTGKGMPRDCERAIRLLEPIAAGGNAEAQHWLEEARKARDGRLDGR